jgi:urea carboxylase
MFSKVLIANRGAIACRIIRTLRRMGVASVAVYSDADKDSPHVAQADESVHLGAAPAKESYLNQAKLFAAAELTGAQAIHPGYGFLSENADFAAACEREGVVFIGPKPEQMRAFGLKHSARALAQAYGMPLLPGSDLLADIKAAQVSALAIGYPVMLKSTAGGGGIGMQLCWNERELLDTFASVERLAKNNFSQGGVFLEKYVAKARHIEVQVFGDGQNVIALGERDCSVQRRNQKVIEETPAPGLTAATRSKLEESALTLCRAVGYQSAGTVEFVYDKDTDLFYFLEVNTRLQVEHGVTEEVTGLDLVEWMVRIAAGEQLPLQQHQVKSRGHSVQVRLYAEDPAVNYRPASGLLTHVEFPKAARVESWINTGSEVSAHYDPMLAKIIVHAPTRDAALKNLGAVLADTHVHGIETNLEFLRTIVNEEVFTSGEQYTRFLSTLKFSPRTVQVLQPGTHTTVQDYPGRVGYWDIGVPPSGPMDAYAFRIANRLVGNDSAAPALEMTVTGPSLRFTVDSVIALTGAHMKAELYVNAELGGEPIDYWRAIKVRAGSVLKLRGIQGAGQRTYLAVQGGFDVPLYMSSASTFTLGQFGGHAGRALRAGDTLRLMELAGQASHPHALAPSLIPKYTNHWNVFVMYGPHGAPDFFTRHDIDALFATDWQVHYNSSRTGVRLIGPKPKWARSDGGEAGLHPSNIHDNAYAIGSIDFTGDMPVILGPDGPSLGGFVCPATIIHAELWKLGQLKPGDTVRFHSVSVDQAVAMERALDDAIASLTDHRFDRGAAVETSSPVLRMTPERADRVAVCYRQAGDKYLLVEYGALVLDLELRFRVHALMLWLQAQRISGILELTPGIRSLQVHYDSRVLSQSELIKILERAEEELPNLDDLEVSSRIVHLPLSWDDPATRLAIEKYMQSVRADAPWCPSNLEFIRRINGLDSIDAVHRIVFDASYLVMGLGDVYLGAPVATPLDPRHRLVTTKYNPARTWTPENAVGIGGAYLCVYGMEGPGGYQFVGRTIQMWNRYRQTADFKDGKQWLLRFFDQIRFYPVGAAELLKLREDFVAGRFKLKTEDSILKLRDYRRYLSDHSTSIATFKAKQQAAFDAERERWQAAGQQIVDSEPSSTAATIHDDALPPDCVAVISPVTGSVWQVLVSVGDVVKADQELLVVEAMKMEIPLSADGSGEVVEVRCARGSAVTAGQTLMIVRSKAV